MELIREPIGLRVLVRALRPEDREPFVLWRASPQIERDELVAAGKPEDQAALWAALLRWSEARAAAALLTAAGWEVRLRGVRAIALERAVELLHPPEDGAGWTLHAGDLELRAVPEVPPKEGYEEIAELLSFLDEER